MGKIQGLIDEIEKTRQSHQAQTPDTLLQLVSDHFDELKSARDVGVSWAELATAFATSGHTISASTLRQYFNRYDNRKSRRSSRSKSSKRSAPAPAPQDVAPEPASPPILMAVPPPPPGYPGHQPIHAELVEE